MRPLPELQEVFIVPNALELVQPSIKHHGFNQPSTTRSNNSGVSNGSKEHVLNYCLQFPVSQTHSKSERTVVDCPLNIRDYRQENEIVQLSFADNPV